MASCLDHTVVDEMARRLRNAGLWDNNLGDGLAMLKAKLESLERFGRYEGWDYDKIRRPLASWEQCRQLLAVISASRFTTFSDIPAPVSACLNLAVFLYRWEKWMRRSCLTPPRLAICPACAAVRCLYSWALSSMSSA